MTAHQRLPSYYFWWGERPDLMAQAWRLRHECLVEHRGWPLQSVWTLEIDPYDEDARHCVVTEDGVVVGYARANPTNKPHLLGECFASLLASGQRPNSERVWEISRFVVARQHPKQGPLLATLIHRAMAMGPQVGAISLVAVIEPWMERAVRRQGYAPVALSDWTNVGDRNGRPLFARVAEVLNSQCHGDLATGNALAEARK